MGSKDKRIFRHFVLTCCKCNVSLTSIGDISAHLRHCSSIKKQSKNDSIDVRCGCCAKSFISWRRLVHHLNQPGVHLRQRCTISDTPTSPESSVPLPAVTSIFQGSFSGLTSTYTPTAVALLSAGSFSVPYTTSVSNFSSSDSVSPRYSPVTEPISPATTVSIPFSCDESFTSNPTSDTHSNSSAVLRTPDPYDYDGTDQHYQSSDYSFSPFMSNFQVPSLSFSPDSFQDTYTSDFLDTSVTTVQTSNLPSSDTFTSSILFSTCFSQFLVICFRYFFIGDVFRFTQTSMVNSVTTSVMCHSSDTSILPLNTSTLPPIDLTSPTSTLYLPPAAPTTVIQNLSDGCRLLGILLNWSIHLNSRLPPDVFPTWEPLDLYFANLASTSPGWPADLPDINTVSIHKLFTLLFPLARDSMMHSLPP